MALNGKPNIGLLDTLLQLNELVKSLNGKDFADHITELKTKTEHYNIAKSTTEPLIIELNEAKVKSEDAAKQANVATAALVAARGESERQLQKVEKAKQTVDHAQAELVKLTAEKNAALDKKAQDIVAREKKAEDRIKQADALIAEHTAKIAELRKITG